MANSVNASPKKPTLQNPKKKNQEKTSPVEAEGQKEPKMKAKKVWKDIESSEENKFDDAGEDSASSSVENKPAPEKPRDILVQHSQPNLQKKNGKEQTIQPPEWFMAAQEGNLDLLRVLLINNSNINAEDANEDTALHHAAKNGHLNIIEWLLLNDADINQVNSDKETPLYLASAKGQDEAIALLLKNKADFKINDDSNESPLHAAARFGHVESIRLLLKHIPVDQVDCEQRTPLHTAAIYTRPDVVNLLLENGADVNAVSSIGWSPLRYAFLMGDSPRDATIAVMRLLVNSGADVNHIDKLGYSLLYYAAGFEKIEATSFLLKNGAKFSNKPDHKIKKSEFPDIFNKFKLTFSDKFVRINRLDAAIFFGQTGIAELLLHYGAQTYAKWKAGKIPFPISDLMLAGPVTAPLKQQARPELAEKLVAIFEEYVSGKLKEDDLEAALKAAGLMSPIVTELMSQFHHGTEKMKDITGKGKARQAQIWQTIGGMLADLQVWKKNWPRDYAPFDVAQRKASSRSKFDEASEALLSSQDDSTSSSDSFGKSWISKESQEHLTKALAAQVDVIANLGEQMKSDRTG